MEIVENHWGNQSKIAKNPDHPSYNKDGYFRGLEFREFRHLMLGEFRPGIQTRTQVFREFRL